MAVLREILARFGVDFDDRELKRGAASVDNLADRIRNFAGVAAAAAVGTGVGIFLNSIREAGTEIANVSQQMGLSTRALQQWRFVAADAGLDAGDLFGGFGAIADNAANAAEGTGDMADAFKKLGVDVKDSSGQLKGIEQLIPEMADGFSKLTNETEKSNIAQTIAGDDGLRLLGVFRRGSAGIEELRKEFEKLGAGMSDEGIERSRELTAEFGKLGIVFDAIKGQIAQAVFPQLSRLTRGLREVIGETVGMVRGTRIVEAAFGVLGAAAVALAIRIAIAFAPAIASFVGIAVAVGVAVLAIDDLIALFSGGESVIGAFVDKVFGIGSAQKMVETLTRWWDRMTDALNRIDNQVDLVRAGLGALGVVALALAAKVVIAFSPVILSVALIAAGIAALIFVVDDLIKLFTTGKSTIGDFIDELFGVGSAQKMVEDLARLWEQLGDTLKWVDGRINIVRTGLIGVGTVAAASAARMVLSFGAASAKMAFGLIASVGRMVVAFVPLIISAGIAAVEMLIAFAPVILTVLAVAAAIAAVVYVVNDLIKLFTTGKSDIGDFIDSLFGLNTAQRWVENITRWWESLTAAVKGATRAVADFLGFDLGSFFSGDSPRSSGGRNFSSEDQNFSGSFEGSASTEPASDSAEGASASAVVASLAKGLDGLFGNVGSSFSESVGLARQGGNFSEPTSAERLVSVDNSRGGNTSLTLNQTNNVTVNAPSESGSTESIRSAVMDAISQENAKAMAALVPEGA